MKKIVALAAAVLVLTAALTLAGCGGRLARGRDQGTPTQQQTVPAPAVTGTPGSIDPGAADGDLTDVDGLLGGVDTDLSAAADKPADSD